MIAKKKLKKGEVRNLISLPDKYGKQVTVDGKRVWFYPKVEVSVFKDKWGRYTVLDKGHRLTASEKRLGLKRTRTKEAQFIKSEYERSGPYTKMRKLPDLKGKSSSQYKHWQVGANKGWLNVKKVGLTNGKGEAVNPFIVEDSVGRTGDIEILLYSISRTTYAINNGLDLVGMWKKLTAKEKFAVMVELEKIDWENFFNEYIDSDGIFSDYIDESKQEIGVSMVHDILTR